MQTGEKTNDTQENVEKSGNTFCCGTGSGERKMADCCESMPESHDCRSKISKMMKACRWFPMIPVMLGLGLFLLGYYVKPETAKVMWMFMAGALVLFGTFALLMAGRMKKICCP